MTPTQITDDMINAGLREWWRDRLTYNTSCDWERMRRTLAAALAAAPVAEEIATLRTRNATLAAWINRGERQVAEQAAEIERLRAALGVDHG